MTNEEYKDFIDDIKLGLEFAFYFRDIEYEISQSDGSGGKIFLAKHGDKEAGQDFKRNAII